MSYPQNYTLGTTATLAQSSAFQGISGQSTVLATDTAIQQDNYAINGYVKPTSVPTFANAGHNAVGRIPRYGQKVASPHYAPPSIPVFQPFGSKVPVSVNLTTNLYADITSKGHANSLGAFYIQDTMSYFRDAVSKVQATDPTLAASATAFLNSVEAGNETTYGPIYPTNITSGDVIYDVQSSIPSSTNLTTPSLLQIGTAAGITRIFSYGDVNVASVAVDNTPTDYVIMFVVGNVVFASSPWNGIANPRKTLIVATGTIVCSGNGSFNAQNYAFAGVSLTINGNPAITPLANGYYVSANGTSTSNANHLDPYATSANAPGVVPYAASAYGSLRWFDLVCDTPTSFPSSVSSAPLPPFAGTKTYYDLLPSTANTDWSDAATNILARMCCQQGVAPVSSLSSSIALNAGVYYASTSFFGVEYTTPIVFQTAASQVPNFGVSTEYHDVDDYFNPDASTTASWLQTYRVADQLYAPMKTAGQTSFRYMTLNGANRLDAFIAPSTTDYVFETVPYYIETTEITADCSVSLSNFSGNTMASGTVGGQDPYTVVDSGLTTFSATSTYRLLVASQTAPIGAILASATMPNKSYLKWAPFDGEVVSSSVGTVVDGSLTIDQWPMRKATIVQATLTCQPSSVSGETMNVAFNGGAVVQAPSTVEFILFKSLQKVRFSLITDAASEVYTIDAGSSQLIGTSEYSYSVSGAVGTLSKVSGGIQTQVGQWTFGAVPATVQVFLTVIFGDTLLANTVFNANTITDGSVPNNYIIRSQTEADVYATRLVQPAGSLLYLPGLSSATKTSLLQLGVMQVAGMPDTWQDVVFHQEASFFPEVAINGRRVATYSGSSSTLVAIGLADGTYTNDADQTVTVSGGTIAASSLPLTVGYITYTAVQLSSTSNVPQVLTLGTDYPNFAAADAALGLSKMQHGLHPGLTYAPTTNNGVKVDAWKGTGSVYYSNGMGGEYQITGNF